MVIIASPQRENGYTGIANEILDNLASTQLNGTQFRIIMVVFRYTYGFRRKDHELSETFLSKATGIHRQQIKRELKELIDRNVLTIIRENDFTNSRLISFNKDYEQWKRELKRYLVSKKVPGSEKDTQERNTKEIFKENIYTVFRHWNSKKIITHKKLSDITRGHINARLTDGYGLDEILKAIDNYTTVLHEPKYYWSHKWTLSEFLLRGLDKFKDESEPLKCYLDKGKQSQPPKKEVHVRADGLFTEDD